VNDQIVSIFAGSQGFLDDLPVASVRPFEVGLLKHVGDEFPEVLDELKRTGELSDKLAETIRKIVGDFKARWVKEGRK
jgi:F-type H+-transporting ATPase subunit alpha